MSPGKTERLVKSRQRVADHGEVFTPSWMVEDMLNLVREESEPFALSYFTYPHLRALFQLGELEIVKEYGSFAKTPLDNSSDQMIFLLRRVKNS